MRVNENQTWFEIANISSIRTSDDKPFESAPNIQKSCPSLLCQEVHCNGCVFSDHAGGSASNCCVAHAGTASALQVCADDVPSMPRIGSSHVCFSLKQSIGLYHGQELHSLPSPLFQIMCSRPAVGCACLISPEMRNIPAWQRRCLSAGCVALAAAGSLRGPGSRVVAGWK